jgi:hypothetical protein
MIASFGFSLLNFNLANARSDERLLAAPTGGALVEDPEVLASFGKTFRFCRHFAARRDDFFSVPGLAAQFQAREAARY